MSSEHKDPKSARPALKLSDTQLVLLSAAAQRDDHCLSATQKLKGGAAQKVAEKLIAAGLVREVKAKSGAPVWRRDEGNAQSFALKLTASGLNAIAVDDEATEEEAEEPTQRNAQTRRTVAPPADVADRGRARPKGAKAPAGDERQPKEGGAASALRPGSKSAGIIDLLQRERGATNDELIAAAGWLSHTTRAALTGLRKRGYVIARSRSDGVTRYTIEHKDRVLNDPHGSKKRRASTTLRDEQAA
jgi:hypothetical protein